MASYTNYGGFNGYGYPYGMPYQQNMQQPQQPTYNNMGNNMMGNQNQQQPQMQPQQQTSYLPLTFTSGVVGVKSFIVAPNQTVFLRDSDEGSDLLFQKSADMYGKYTIKAYHMVEVNLDDVGKPINDVNKNNIEKVATKEDLTNFKLLIDNKINELASIIQKTFKSPKNNGYVKDNDKNE